MVTASTKTTPTSETTTGMPDMAQKFREQLLSTVQQSQQLSVDAAQTWVKAVSVLPVGRLSELPKVPGLPTMPGVETATKFTFDVAADLLNAQRDYALQLANAFAPDKSV